MERKTLTVGLLFGGESPEHEVSIVSAKSIARHLDRDRFQLVPIGVARNGVWAVLGDPFARLADGELPTKSDCQFLPLERGGEQFGLPDVFFNMIHGAGGEDGQIPGYLEMLKVPCTGAGRLALAAAMDKWIAKSIWESAGLPVTPYRAISEEAWNLDLRGFIGQCLELGLPLFVKPANTGSSVGIEKVKDAARLQQAINDAFRYDRRVLVERGIDAREIEVAVLGGYDPIVSAPGEVLVAGEFYDFADKYVDGKSSTQVPADLDHVTAQTIKDMTRRAFLSLDGYGLARVDFFLDRKTGDIYLNEINTIPGFTSISMFPKLLESAGLPYKEQIAMLIDLAISRHKQTAGKLAGYRSGSEWFKS
uniref:D-alanine--D-alanine ligase n=1 Tax=uncultured bacterium contig00001 TaxID=1181493 RepID=A0A806KMK6_9BACT|nr:D-alanine--D-alanine ligase [uncultured bacterium contig00001]